MMHSDLRVYSGNARTAGVVGAPIHHSLSPLIHNAWLADLNLDGLYSPIELATDRFEAFIDSLRGGSWRGLNITVPFKERALRLADRMDEAAGAAGAANLLLFTADGEIEARNTDGLGLLAALREQAPDLNLAARSIVILGAGGAARGAIPPLLAAGAPQVRLVNRTLAKAETLADRFGPTVQAFAQGEEAAAFDGAGLLINASSASLSDPTGDNVPLDRLDSTAVVMDMVYKPLETALLRRARELGLTPVDGLAMLIGQARPSFEAFFGRPAPQNNRVRTLALQMLGEAGAAMP
jgi:shikimate dehydrogenase